MSYANDDDGEPFSESDDMAKILSAFETGLAPNATNERSRAQAQMKPDSNASEKTMEPTNLSIT